MVAFEQRVIELAVRAAESGEFPVGALVHDGQTILGEGVNQKETRQDPTAHAEVLAIQQACHNLGSWRLTGLTLLTTLEPCPMCMGTILQARLGAIVYLAPDKRWGACGTVVDLNQPSLFNHRCQLTYHPNPQVVDLMTSFFGDIGKR